MDLRPARAFPADGAAGEGFTNAAEALTDISPALLAKYLDAAKEVASHAVLLPDGFRFSLSKTRRDWTDEATARLRAFYAAHAPADGRLSVHPYLAAAVRHRDALLTAKTTIEAVAAKEKLNAKYFRILWAMLTDRTSSHPLDEIRTQWQAAGEKDIPAFTSEVAHWQGRVWKSVRIGSYVRPAGVGYAESLTRQVSVEPVGPEREGIRPTSEGYAAFRRVFPLDLCFPAVVPTDEVVSLKMFHREDEPLVRLFLDAREAAELDRLWAEHRFVSRQPVAENDYLPQFIGFVTQDQPKSMLVFFEGQRPAFRVRADDFLKEEASAIPKQLDALLVFAGRA